MRSVNPKSQQEGSRPLAGELGEARGLSLAARLHHSRGAIIFLGSRLVMIGCGFATYAIVARKLSTADFGVYGVIGAIVNVLNTVLGVATNQGISRLVSRNPVASWTLLARGLRWSWLVTALAGVGLLMTAPLLAALLRDASLTPLLMIVALVPGLYTINAAYAGFLNGMRDLSRQGYVNISLSLARLVLIAGAAYCGYGLVGTSWGLVAAAMLAVVAARLLAQIPAGKEKIELPASTFVRLMLGFVGVSLLLQLLLANDLLLIKRLAPAEVSNQQAGIYTAAQSLARIPYYFLTGISQMVYPRLTVAMTKRDVYSARTTSSLVISGLLVVLGGILALCVPLSGAVIQIIYPQRYTEGAATLRWLLTGSAALSLAEASLTMLSGAAGPRPAIGVLAAAVLLQVLLGLLLIPSHGMLGAAISTLCSSLLGVLASFLLLRKVMKTSLVGRLLGTALVPLGLLVFASSMWARSGSTPISTILFIAVAYTGYLATLYLANARSLKQLFSDPHQHAGLEEPG